MPSGSTSLSIHNGVEEDAKVQECSPRSSAKQSPPPPPGVEVSITTTSVYKPVCTWYKKMSFSQKREALDLSKSERERRRTVEEKAFWLHGQ
jgi:hypothetical protein